MSLWSWRRLCALTCALLLALVLWDASALDLPLARLAGDASGFGWRSVPVFVWAFHELPRLLSSALLAALWLGVWWPWGFLKPLPRADRLQLAASVVAAMTVVTLIKRFSATSCPWDLAEFGGVAQYVSHWNWWMRDEGGGHCFPGGHASAAFAYLAGWFVLRRTAPAGAQRWWMVVLAAGLLLGGVQQVRGAHYMSHTFWSAWICWATGLAVEAGLALWRARSGLRAARDTKLNEV